MIRCPFCRWFKTPSDKIGRAIFVVHMRSEPNHG